MSARRRPIGLNFDNPVYRLMPLPVLRRWLFVRVVLWILWESCKGEDRRRELRQGMHAACEQMRIRRAWRESGAS